MYAIYIQVAPQGAEAPSDTVRGLSERMLELKKMLLNTKHHAQVLCVVVPLYVSLYYYICVCMLLAQTDSPQHQAPRVYVYVLCVLILLYISVLIILPMQDSPAKAHIC